MRSNYLLAIRIWMTAGLALLACCWVMAQQAVTVQPVLTPPYSPYLESYLDKALINLTNHTAQTLRLKLSGEIEGDNGLFVRTEADWRPAEPIMLMPFQTRTVYVHKRSENFLDPNNVETNVDRHQQADIARSGILPEGIYSFCITAADYDHGTILSAPAPQGCSMVAISYPEPPMLTNPFCETAVWQNPVFSWTTPAGNLAGADLRYDFYLVKLLPGQDPNEAMMAAYNYNAGNPFVIKNLKTNVYAYLPSDPPLETDATYAFMVRARDANNKIVFQNDGKSEVCTFMKQSKSGPGSPGVIEGNLVNNDDGSNDVAPPAPTDPLFCADACRVDPVSIAHNEYPDIHQSVTVGMTVKMGTFDLKITALDPPDPNHPNTITGKGVLPIPFINYANARVRVHFDSLKVNTNNEVFAGTAEAIDQNFSDPGFMPQYDDPNWDGISMAGADITALGDWIDGQIEDIKNGVYTIWQTLGFEMPLGYERGGHAMAITKMWFYPYHANFSAIAVVDLPDFTPVASAVALGASRICFTKNDLCGQGKLYLAQDFTVDASVGQPGNEFTLLGASGDPQSTFGTYMLFDKQGVSQLNIEANWSFPPDKIIKVDANGNNMGVAKAHLMANMQTKTDWLFKASMDYFQIAGSPEFTFLPSDIWIDLSDAVNPPPPQQGSILYEMAADPSWKGLFCDQLAAHAQLPFNEANAPTILEINDLYIDDTGVSVKISGKDLVTLGDGKIQTFNFSLANIEVEILHNSFLSGGFDGAMLLNFQDRVPNAKQIFVANGNNSVIPYFCTISKSAPGNGPSLDYQFIMQPSGPVEMPIWKFTLTLDPSSKIEVSNANGSFGAQALLSGSFGINANIPLVGGTQFFGVEFQNLNFTSYAPYFSMQNLSMSSASPQHSIGGPDFAEGAEANGSVGGFPISLGDINFVTDAAGHPGVQFNMMLELTDSDGLLPAASTALSIFGRIDVNPQTWDVTPAFDHAALDQICLDGKLSVLHVKGCIDFFNGHQVYGDGFRGQLEVDFPPEVKVQATVQFGKVSNYSYWYADALAIIPGGIPLFAGVNAFGFGGGAYYHMSRSQDVPNYNLQSQPNGNGAGQPGYSMSGVQYVPNASVDLGIKAKVYIGTAQRDVFNADVALEITVVNGGLGTINLDGNARFISNDEMTKGTVTGNLAAFYDNQNKIFSSQVSANLDLVVFSATGKLEVYFDGGNGPLQWYVRFGRPISNQWVNMNIAGFYKVETYFQVGNKDIDPMPGPPDFIKQLGLANFVKPAPERGSGSFAIIHGGRSGFDFEGKFLVFYAKLKAGFGYDIALEKLTAGCGGQGDPNKIGFNGWYATGQAYAGLLGEVGIEVDLGFVSGRYTIVELGAGAYLMGGFVNPTWVKGGISGQYNLFDGAISGNFTYEFGIGDACKPAPVDPLTKIKLISDVFPANNKTNVDVTSTPSAAMSLPMNKYEHIHMHQKDAQGNIKHRLFYFSDDLVSLELKKNGVVQDIAEWEKNISSDKFGIGWDHETTLDSKTWYSFTVTAKMKECVNVAYDEVSKKATCTGNNWADAKMGNGTLFKETKTSTFKTNDGLDKIPESIVGFTVPFQQTRTFMVDEWNKPTIQLSKGFNPNSYKLGASPAEVKFKARLIPMYIGSNVSTVPVNIVPYSKTIQFEWPASLDPKQYYSIQLIAEWEMPQAGNQNQTRSDFVKKEVADSRSYHNNVYFKQYKTVVDQTKMSVPSNAVVLYEIRFKTSEYKSMQEKLADMSTWEAGYMVRPKNKTSFMKAVVDKPALGTPASIVAAINQKAGNPNGTVPDVSHIAHVWMTGVERFDYYDVKGYVKVANGETFNLPPLVHYQNAAISGFETNLHQALMKTLQTGGLLNIQSQMLGPGYTMKHWVEAPYIGLISWNEGMVGFNNNNNGGLNIPPVNIELGGPVYVGNGWEYGGNKTIKFCTGFDYSSGWAPVAINPNVPLLDLVSNTQWNVQPTPQTYAQYMQQIGIAYDQVGSIWGTLGTLGGGTPVILTKQGFQLSIP